MAYGFDFDTAGRLFADLEIRLDAAPADEKLIGLLAGFRRRLSAVEARTLADMKALHNTDYVAFYLVSNNRPAIVTVPAAEHT